MDQFGDLKISRLASAINSSRQVLRRPRQNRKKFAEQFAGSNYNENGAPHEVPVNFIAQYVTIVVRNLIAQTPRELLSTFDPQMKQIVEALEKWGNSEVVRMGLKTTLERGVYDALFSIGIVKVGLASPADAANSAWATGAGQPFAEIVDLDDFAYDRNARDFRSASWIGHRFRVPLDAIKSDNTYDPDGRERLTASTDPPFNAEGDERIKQIGQTYHGTIEEYDDMVDLWEVYLPKKKLVVTLADNELAGVGSAGSTGRPLKVQRWIGPDTGPYHFLGFGPVPGNAMPKAPLMDLYPLHMALNNTMRKLLRQAERLKEVTGVRGRSDADAIRINNANDGEVVHVESPDDIVPRVYGGPNANLFTFFTQLHTLFSWFAGNLDSLGGLSPQAQTATQDQMLEKNSSRGISWMQDRVIEWTSSILNALNWYWYHHPDTTMASPFSAPGYSQASIVRRISPTDRMQRRYEDLDIRVDPYSMQHSTPQQRLSMVNNLVESVIIPMAPILSQQGVMLDANKWLALNAKYGDMPDLSDILSIAEPPDPDDAGAGGGGAPDPGSAGPQPAQTQRTYVRQNMPGRTMQGDMIDQMNRMRGQDVGGASGGNKAAQNAQGMGA